MEVVLILVVTGVIILAIKIAMTNPKDHLTTRVNLRPKHRRKK